MPSTTVERLNAAFEDAHPREVLAWAFESMERFVISTSFQAQGLVNVHMARSIVDRVPVLFLQTGFHFPETIAFRDRIVAEWDLDLHETQPTLGPQRQAAEIHPELYRVDPDRCCYLNKVAPLERALEHLDGWATGLRRDQAPTRLATPVLERQRLASGRELWKVNPLATWTRDMVWGYIETHQIPVNPLYEKGYLSIGCAPCTQPAVTEERDGRWAGSDKTECGIHDVGRRESA